RYLAARLADARIRAIRRSSAAGLRFQPASPDYLVTAVADGNGNGLRSVEIQRRIDRTVSEAEAIGWHFTDVSFGILENVPDADGQPANGSDGVRGSSSRARSAVADRNAA